MGRTVNFDEIPDSTLLPADNYTFEVEDLSEETSKKGYLMYKGTMRVVEPAEFAGTPLFEYFAIGNENDPTASEQKTWATSVGAKRLKRLFKATMITFTQDVDEMVESAKGQRFIGSVTQETDDGTRDPKFAGTKRNRLQNMYPIGTTAIGKPATAPAAAATKPATKAAPASTMSCPFCQESVTRAEYSEHVKAKHPDEA